MCQLQKNIGRPRKKKKFRSHVLNPYGPPVKFQLEKKFHAQHLSCGYFFFGRKCTGPIWCFFWKKNNSKNIAKFFKIFSNFFFLSLVKRTINLVFFFSNFPVFSPVHLLIFFLNFHISLIFSLLLAVGCSMVEGHEVEDGCGRALRRRRGSVRY